MELGRDNEVMATALSVCGMCWVMDMPGRAPAGWCSPSTALGVGAGVSCTARLQAPSDSILCWEPCACGPSWEEGVGQRCPEVNRPYLLEQKRGAQSWDSRGG